MSEQYMITAANLNYIENSLNVLQRNLETINSAVNTTNNNVQIIYGKLDTLTNDFNNFVQEQIKANRLNQAHTIIVQVRQELENKYGHYDIVRRTTTGILQADDLGIVKRDTISTATEELMLSTPNYWLAACLVSLAAWINDQKELAYKALGESIKRNDEKTSLFYTLVCRRADRKSASLKWLQRYLAKQDEENLDRKTIIVLDAYASGLMGADSEGVISKQMGVWMDHLTEKPGFVEKQTTQWSDAILQKRRPLSPNKYQYLQKYSRTWGVLKSVMEGAMLHEELLKYLTDIFEKDVSSDSLKAELDEILTSLVTDFDDEELSLRRKEKFEQFVIDCNGDELAAQQMMTIEQTAFEEHKDFTQLLTDAAMKSDSSNANISTQKFAIALSKEWISNAYNDVTATNRARYPREIEINVDTFNDRTTDGSNERELIERFNSLIEREKKQACSQYFLSGFAKFCLGGGIAIIILGLIMAFTGGVIFGIMAVIAGTGMIINHCSKKKNLDLTHQRISDQFEKKRSGGIQIIRAVLAEVVDFKAKFKEKDAQSIEVISFLDQIAPDQYVKKLSDSSRRIKI